MSDLIRREEVINIIHNKIQSTSDYLQHDALIELEADVEEIPIVEAVPVVHGEWKDELGLYYPILECSVCGGLAPKDCEGEEFYKSNFCPNCGADMRKKV